MLSGCASGRDAEDEPAIPLSAEAYRSREDDAAGGRIHVRLTNTGDAPVTVTSVALDSPGFESAPETRREIELGPGNRIDVEAGYGAVRCDTGPEPAYAVIGTAERAATPVRVPLATPYDVLGRIHDGDCAAEELARAVPVTLIPEAAPPEPAAPLPARLVVSRGTASGDIRVDEVGGSVLYALRGALPATMRADEDQLNIDITIDAARCDPHALAEAKKPFVFPLWIAVGSSAPAYSRIPVSEENRRTLTNYLTTTCDARR
ncbi:hypothetical protein [Rhodococcus opacus]|uniref:Uncharacterized protein n=1 Tax=Rhodococcus opacus (strain B4) TaxID=632772 RepID=C1AUH9_RHOOB|nr:hypothetical protein [Rhodococcus opacus]BAH49187.1 hypothetical protein ROP_09400 [Rhodococcus opacus B4]